MESRKLKVVSSKHLIAHINGKVLSPREKFYKDIINACNDAISQMDKAVAQARNSAGADKPQIELLKNLVKQTMIISE